MLYHIIMCAIVLVSIGMAIGLIAAITIWIIRFINRK